MTEFDEKVYNVALQLFEYINNLTMTQEYNKLLLELNGKKRYIDGDYFYLEIDKDLYPNSNLFIYFFLNYLNNISNGVFIINLVDAIYSIVLFEYYNDKHSLNKLIKDNHIIIDTIQHYIYVKPGKYYMDINKINILNTTVSNCDNFLMLCQKKSLHNIKILDMLPSFNSKIELKNNLLQKEWIFTTNQLRGTYFSKIMKLIWLTDIQNKKIDFKLYHFVMDFKKKYNIESKNCTQNYKYITTSDIQDIFASKYHFEDYLFSTNLIINYQNNKSIELTKDDKNEIYNSLIHLKWILRKNASSINIELDTQLKLGIKRKWITI